MTIVVHFGVVPSVTGFFIVDSGQSNDVASGFVEIPPETGQFVADPGDKQTLSIGDRDHEPDFFV